MQIRPNISETGQKVCCNWDALNPKWLRTCSVLDIWSSKSLIYQRRRLIRPMELSCDVTRCMADTTHYQCSPYNRDATWALYYVFACHKGRKIIKDIEEQVSYAGISMPVVFNATIDDIGFCPCHDEEGKVRFTRKESQAPEKRKNIFISDCVL